MANAAESGGADDNEINLGELFTQLLARKWTLLWALVIGLVLGWLNGQLAPNEWRSAALIQIEERSSGVQLPTELIGDLMGALGEPESSFATEIHVIRSGLILDPVVTDLGLTTRVSPAALPVVGDAVDRLDLYGRVPLLDALVPARYPRPGETVTVARLVRDDMSRGFGFTLTVRDATRFSVTWRGETLTGQVGAPLALGAAGTLEMAALDAAPGRVFEIRALPVRSARRQVANSLSISERGGRTGTGIVDFAMTGPDPDAAEDILATVIETYQRANIRRRSTALDQSIDFIESQLPEVRAELDRSVDRLSAFRGQQDAQELSLGTQQIVEQSVELEARLQQLDFQIEDLLERVTPNHPDYRALVAERERVSQRFDAVQDSLQMVPAAEQDLARLTEQVERARQLELQLVERIEQLRILRASTVGTIRMLEPAQQAELVGPDRRRPALLAGLLTLILAIAWILGRNAFRAGVEDARDVESLGLSLFATVGLDPNGQKEGNYRMVTSDPESTVSEAFRGLRTGLQFSLAVNNAKVVMITSSTPSEGKSFTASNLAAAAALAGSKVLLVDADLRRGKLHRAYDIARARRGLTQVLAGEVPLEQACYSTDVETLTLVPTGTKPPNPSELLSSPAFEEIVAQAREAYDLVILDAPPVLAVADPLILGQQAGITLLVVRHLKTTQAELQSTLKSLEGVGIQVSGAILNQFDARRSRYGQYSQKYGYQYGGYRYKYARDKSEAD